MKPLIKLWKQLCSLLAFGQQHNALRYHFYEPQLHSSAIHSNKIGKSSNDLLIRLNKMKPNIKKTIIIITASGINSYSYAELLVSSIEYTLNTLFYSFTSQ